MPNVIWVDLDKLDLSEGAPALMFDLADDFVASGEVSARFQPTEPIEFLEAGGIVTWKPKA